MVPDTAVAPRTEFMAPATTNDPAGTDTGEDAVSTELCVAPEQSARSGGSGATPEYSAIAVRIEPLVDGVNITDVVPARAVLRYQRESIPSEPASDQRPFRLSATFGLDGDATMAIRRSPAETGRGSTTDNGEP